MDPKFYNESYIDFFNESIDDENYNATKNNNASDSDLKWRNVLITISYTLIVLISLIGNSLVFKTIAFQPKMRTSTNILIAVLAVSDLLTTLFNIPFTVVDIILTDWIFGQFFCIFVSFIQANCVYVSSFTMAVIAINRWRAVYQTRVQGSSRNENKLCSGLFFSIVMVWILAALHSLPHSMFNTIKVYNTTIHGPIRRCHMILPESKFDLRLWLTVETFFTQYIIPLSLAGFVYSRIAFTICSQGRVGQMTEERNRQMSEKKRRRIIMLILVVAIFALVWAPFNIYYLLLDGKIIKKTDFKIFLLCHWLAMSSICYNPFVYCWLNENFRNEAKKMFQIILKFRNVPVGI